LRISRVRFGPWYGRMRKKTVTIRPSEETGVLGQREPPVGTRDKAAGCTERGRHRCFSIAGMLMSGTVAP